MLTLLQNYLQFGHLEFLQYLDKEGGGGPAGAGGSESGGGGTPSGDANRGDEGDDVFSRDQVDEIVREAVAKAVKSNTGKLKSQAERQRDQAADAAVSAFREEHGLDDDALEKVKSQRSELDQLKSDHAKNLKELERVRTERDGLRTSDRNRRVNEALDSGIRSFSRKTGNRLIDDAKPDVIASLRPRLRPEDDGRITVLGDDGEPLHGTEVGEFLADELGKRKWALEPTTKGGAGSRPGGKGDKQQQAKPNLGTDEGMGALFGNPGLGNPALAKQQKA